jgi:hypothetical protein
MSNIKRFIPYKKPEKVPSRTVKVKIKKVKMDSVDEQGRPVKVDVVEPVEAIDYPRALSVQSNGVEYIVEYPI